MLLRVKGVCTRTGNIIRREIESDVPRDAGRKPFYTYHEDGVRRAEGEIRACTRDMEKWERSNKLAVFYFSPEQKTRPAKIFYTLFMYVYAVA